MDDCCERCDEVMDGDDECAHCGWRRPLSPAAPLRREADEIGLIDTNGAPSYRDGFKAGLSAARERLLDTAESLDEHVIA